MAFETLALLTSPNDDGEFMLALFVATAALLEIALAWPPTPALLAATLDVTLEKLKDKKNESGDYYNVKWK